MNDKLRMRRILSELFGEGRLDVIQELFDPNFINHNTPAGFPPGTDGLIQIVTMERVGFPDLTYRVLHEFQDGEFVIQHALVDGTHLGPIFGISPTGRRVEWREMHIARVQNGKCVEHWGCNDMASLWVQLGRVPPVQAQARK